MRRGEIRLVNLDPAVGTEAARERPAVIVSNDGANTVAALLARGVVTVAPVTSNIEMIHPFQVLVAAADTGLARDSKVQLEQVRSVDVSRVGRCIGLMPIDRMGEVSVALRLHLDL